MPFSAITDIPETAEIISRRALTSDTTLFRLRLTNKAVADAFRFIPGQFLQVSAAGIGEAPFSPISGPEAGGIIELCIRRVGHVTTKIHTLAEGEKLYIRGPFGNGFPVTSMEGQDLYLLAGGLGIVPIHSLLSYLVARRERYGSITVMYGAKEPTALLLREELQEISCQSQVKLMLTVDFAPTDEKGNTFCKVGLLPDLLRGTTIVAHSAYAAVCGPPSLYRCIIGELTTLGFTEKRILLSLERRMKCGLGRCAHCAIGQSLCCIDGPVYHYSAIKAIEGAI